MRRLSPLIMIAVLTAACSVTPSDYSRFTNLPERGWAYGDTVRFTPDTIDPTSPKQLSVAVRHNNDYEYSNLWLEVTYMTADSVTCRDTLSMELADVYGHWRGHGSGPSLQVVDTLAHGVALRRGQQVRVRHIMRLDTLPGIEQVGITFLPRETL